MALLGEAGHFFLVLSFGLMITREVAVALGSQVELMGSEIKRMLEARAHLFL